MITLKNITKVYNLERNEEALAHVSLTFSNSGFTSILGPSGCGKTTMLNIIGGLDSFTEGDLFINGTSIKSFKDSELDNYRSCAIGFVFQGYNLIPDLTVFENVKLGLEISNNKSEMNRLVNEALDKVGILHLASALPKEISGGQQQRVAIARAIVKNPEVLLCDEPTGALDSKHSIEVLEVLKSISKNKLVIMVTHNEELAYKYSDRIITMKDGKILSDTKPEVEINESKVEFRNSKIPFLLNLKMALRNINKKRKKNILISIAASLGIVGLALIIGITRGFNNYLYHMEQDALSRYPIQIFETAYDTDMLLSFLGTNSNNTDANRVKYPTDNKLFINYLKENIHSYSKENNITNEYLDYVYRLDKDLYKEIMVKTHIDISMNIYSSYELYNSHGSIYDVSNQYMEGKDIEFSPVSFLSMLPDNQSFLKSQYDCIYGKLPMNKNEMVLVLDAYNQLSDVAIMALGLSNRLEDQYFHFNDLIGTKYNLVLNNERYYKEKSYTYSLNKNITYDNELEIVGIIRPKEGKNFGVLNSGIAYTKELYNYIVEENFNSDIAIDLRNEEKITIDGNKLDDNSLKTFGATKKIYSVKIFPTDDKAKDEIEKYLTQWNSGKKYAEQIMYSDYMAVLTDTISLIFTQVTYILYGFVILSLLVSSIMIGVITYNSITERIKEIGILRSLGAKKKDVSLMFNLENMFMGLTAGCIGLMLSLFIGILINIFANSNLGITSLFTLSWYEVLILIFISIILSFASGTIPAYLLSKKKPVSCIRSE